MPSIRTSHDDRLALAIDDLVAAASQTAGLSISPTGPDDRVTVEKAGSEPWHAKVHPRSSLSPREAQVLVATETTRGAHVVVADQISAQAKEYLATVPEWSWLDRRSELRIRHRNADVEVRLPARGLHPGTGPGVPLASPAGDGPIRGRAGISYAAALLLGEPGSPPSIRSVARQVGMAPSTISEAVSHLRNAGLIRPGGEPELPDLFWALAGVWRPIRARPVSAKPIPSKLARLSPNVDDLDAEGWAQGGDEAALAWGAPMFLAGSRPWIWVPGQVAARRAERDLGPAAWARCEAVIAVPPTPLVCINRLRPPSSDLSWPTPHPLFLALDLARDRGRGREILRDWTQPLLDPPPWAEAP